MVKAKRMRDAEYQALIERSMEELRLKMAAHDSGASSARRAAQA